VIIDTLQNITRYRGINKNLDTAIEYLLTHDLSALPNGKTVIDKDRVFVNVMDASLRPAEGATFEYHQRYADLQIDLTGMEYWAWSTVGEEREAFCGMGDVGFAAGPEQVSGVLGEGRFALFLPGELHKPSCICENWLTLRKAVIKIEM